MRKIEDIEVICDHDTQVISFKGKNGINAIALADRMKERFGWILHKL